MNQSGRRDAGGKRCIVRVSGATLRDGCGFHSPGLGYFGPKTTWKKGLIYGLQKMCIETIGNGIYLQISTMCNV